VFSRVLLAVLAVSSLAGCQVAFYGQAIRGQAQILSKQRPVERLLARPSTPEALKERLRTAREMVAFAADHLELPADENYTTYADLGRDYVLWSVFAAPELSVDPISWDYPVVGSLDYRGYFSQAAAEAFADKLRAKQLDVAIAPVPAYSTLGLFDDPLLNTFLDDKPTELASLIFHELTHKKYYRAGDTSFSEALAVAVEREGVRRWLRHQGDSAGLADYERRLKAVDKFVRRILETRRGLKELYESAIGDAEKLTRKQAILSELQGEIRRLLTAAGKSPKDDFWLREPLGNAHLNAISAYYLRVPEFERLLAAKDGDLGQFFEALKGLP